MESKPKTSPNVSEEVMTSLNELIIVSAIGAWTLLKLIFSIYAPISILILAGVVWASYLVIIDTFHIKFLHSLSPELLTHQRLQFLFQYSLLSHWMAIGAIFLWAVAIPVGWVARYNATKYRNLFLSMGLKTSLDAVPKLLKKKKLDRHRTCYIFDANGIGLSEFETKKERFEAYYKSNLESILHGKNKNRIEITFNKQNIPKSITYEELQRNQKLPVNHFYVGQSAAGAVVQDVTELPHLLIAGSTGSGKSVFFKQALLGLLESTDNLQMYLIDLKGGLEMIDFVSAKNVKVVKTMSDALQTLKKVQQEMFERFKYLEEGGKKKINPDDDGKPRIIVAIDEASVLYMKRNAQDPDRNNALEARTLADSIAKLSRAAAIHLLMATQKVENNVIPTSVTENISGRMAFRTNSFQGSNQMLGSKDAMKLPEIPGRGIWQFGTSQVTIQTPYINESEIKKRIVAVQNKRKIISNVTKVEMLGEEVSVEQSKIKNNIKKSMKPRKLRLNKEE